MSVWPALVNIGVRSSELLRLVWSRLQFYLKHNVRNIVWLLT